MALIPQFVDAHAGSGVEPGFPLGSEQIAISLTMNAVIVLAAGPVTAFLVSRPAWARWQRRLTGTLLGAVGLRLAINSPVPAATD